MDDGAGRIRRIAVRRSTFVGSLIAWLNRSVETSSSLVQSGCASPSTYRSRRRSQIWRALRRGAQCREPASAFPFRAWPRHRLAQDLLRGHRICCDNAAELLRRASVETRGRRSRSTGEARAFLAIPQFAGSAAAASRRSARVRSANSRTCSGPIGRLIRKPWTSSQSRSRRSEPARAFRRPPPRRAAGCVPSRSPRTRWRRCRDRRRCRQ